MKEKLQKIFSQWNEALISDCEAVNDMVIQLRTGDKDDIEMARYIVQDTTYEGNDYLTDYHIIKMLQSKYEMEE